MNTIYRKLLNMVQSRLDEEDSRARLEADISASFRLTSEEAAQVLKEFSQKGLIRFDGRKIKL